MSLRARIFLTAGMVMVGHVTYAQNSMQPRVLGLGGNGATVQDIRGFAWNPAGLTGMRDWDFAVTSYTGLTSETAGFVFHSVAVGKRFLGNEALGLEFAPGAQLGFVFPPTLSVGGDNTPVTNERRLEYQEPVSVAYAHRFSEALSAGLGLRYRSEEVSDTQVSLVPGDSIPLIPVTSGQKVRGETLAGDAGLMWQPAEHLSVGLTGRNLLRLQKTRLPDSLQQYALPDARRLEAGLGFRPSPALLLAATVSTNGTGSAGLEWAPGAGLRLRGAGYWSKREQPFVDAVSAGLGWTYEILDLEVGYIHYTSASASTGDFQASEFDVERIATVDLNPYAGDRVSFSVKAMFGNVRESLARIERVSIDRSVYPSSFEMFAYRPIGTATVRNLSGKPIRARVSFYVDRFMDAPTESAPVTLEPGGTAEVDLMAIFNERVAAVTSAQISEASVSVAATLTETLDDRRQVALVIRGRNDWDGSAESLRFFVTPDDPDVLRASRDMLLQNSAALAGASATSELFLKARVILQSFAGKLLYVNDPKLSTDYVQYPAETLRLRGGDCDDMTVCFASLLSSVGISTAFVDVVPPSAPEKSHVYLLFDTGLEPRYGSSISENPKRYVVRKGKSGKETVWIPIETTVISKGFDEAWTAGAQAYFDDVELGLGVARGWVRIYDVN
jgi:hypothetical protein